MTVVHEREQGASAAEVRGMPRVSVVVPCHNYGHFLEACVASALDQPDVDVDVLIVDDASTDDSADVAAALADRNPRVSLLRHEVNKGHIATYNDGLAAIDGDYAVLLSADDLLPSGSLTRATALFEANPSVGLVYGYPMRFRDLPPAAPLRTKGWSVWSGREWVELMCKRARNCIFNPEVVMRTSVLHEIGGYRSDLPFSGDLELWLRAAAVADVGRVKGAVQGFYRVHGSNMTQAQFDGTLVDLEARRDAFAVAFSGPAGSLDDADRLHLLARRQLATEAVGHAARSLDLGTHREEPLEGYLQFATDVYPDATSLRAWRALARRRGHGDDGIAKQRGARLRERRRDLRDRVDWRRWRRTGL